MSPDRFGFHSMGESQIHSSEFVEEHKGLGRVASTQRQVSSPTPSSLLTTTSITNNKITTTIQDNSHVFNTAPVEPSSSSTINIANRNAGFATSSGHDSSGFTSGGNPRLGAPRHLEETQFWNSENRNNPQSLLQGSTMGLTNIHNNEGLTRQQRTVSEHEEPKMESNNQSTTSVTTGDYLHTNERKDHEDDSTTAHSVDSSVPSPALSYREDHVTESNALGTTTPSTVSTAASTTDEASMLDPTNLDRLSLRFEGNEGIYRHRRGPSWESHTLPLPATPEPRPHEMAHFAPGSHVPTNNVWNNPQAHARIASFRNDAESSRYGFRPPEAMWAHPQHANPIPPPQPTLYRHPSPNPYSTYPNPSGSGPRGHSALPPTPPRGSGRGQRAPQSPHHRGASSYPSPSPGQGPGSRSSAEVLKTLLRKKACLYEPDTSRAVALVTWLVGRELALEFGFFSRQQLQAGVHACVAQKIDSGVITRTKVNRCMQIILNSCFHYIIPRPDGSEENGEFFRLMFAREVMDDAVLLRELPAPWDDLTVSSDIVLAAAVSDGKTPQSSPMVSSMGNPSSDSKDEDEDHEEDNKRAVLLCFNENVRCAEDVFRCHNEFIRDTAHACHLQLSSYEWGHFFGAEAASALHLWGNIGIPIPSNEMCDPGQVDALGMLSMNELSKFRTFWCSKRYEHDHELCGFAHIEVNGGWLRRNPAYHNYQAEMCQFVTRHTDPRMGSKVVIINECPHGTNCVMSHSAEEVFYHPMRYKRRVCTSTQRHSGICHHGDSCPDFHAMDKYRFPSKKIDGRAGARHSRHTGALKGNAPPSGAPVLYVSPAPPSRFEEHLVLPGLKSLYRRHCSVARAHIRQGAQCESYYSNFGDDTGVAADNTGAIRTAPQRLPPAPPH